MYGEEQGLEERWETWVELRMGDPEREKKGCCEEVVGGGAAEIELATTRRGRGCRRRSGRSLRYWRGSIFGTGVKYCNIVLLWWCGDEE